MISDSIQNVQSNNSGIKILSFLLSPVLCFLLILPSLHKKTSRFLLFCVLITVGYSFSMPLMRTPENNLDCISFRVDFENSIDINSRQFTDEFISYISLDGKSDFYADTLYYGISRLTSNYHYLFFIVSIIYAFFFVKVLRFFVLHENYSFSHVGCIIMLYLFSINQILQINMFRFFTALIIALYAVFQIYVNRKRRYYLLLAITPFFHGSFFLMYLLVLLNYIIGRYQRLCMIFLLLGFFSSLFASVFVEYLQEALLFLPGALYDKYHYYLGDAYMEYINSGGSGFIWLKRLLEDVFLVLLNVGTFFLYKERDVLKVSSKYKLYEFFVVLMVFVNFTMVIPSVGSRFILLAVPLFAYLWMVLSLHRKRKLFTYTIGCFLLIVMIMPFPIFTFPCLYYYTYVLEPAYMLTPIYSALKYLAFY